MVHNPEGQDLPSQVFHHFAPGPFLRRSTYISHNGSIAWSSAEGAFRGHPRRCAEICRSTSYTYLNLCLSLEEPKCLHADSRSFKQGDLNRKIVLILAHKGRFSSNLVALKFNTHLQSNVDVLDICLLCALWERGN